MLQFSQKQLVAIRNTSFIIHNHHPLLLCHHCNGRRKHWKIELVYSQVTFILWQWEIIYMSSFSFRDRWRVASQRMAPCVKRQCRHTKHNNWNKTKYFHFLIIPAKLSSSNYRKVNLLQTSESIIFNSKWPLKSCTVKTSQYIR